MKKRFLNKALKILLITNGLILLAGAMLGPIYALLVERIGGNLLNASLSWGVFALVAGVVTLISGKFSDKIKENELMVFAGYIIMAIGFFLYLFADSIAFLFVIQGIIGFGEAIYVPSFDAIYSKHLTKKREGGQWGVWEAIRHFSVFVGAVVGGFIAFKFGFNVLFITMGAISLISGFYILFLNRKVL